MKLADIYCVINKKIRLSDPTYQTQFRQPLIYNNARAHAFRVTVFNDDGTAADLSAVGVTGTFLNANNATVSPLTGATSGNVAEIILPPACYSVVGRYTFDMNLTVTVNDVSYIRTVMTVEGTVKKTTSAEQLDPGTPVTNIDQIISQANAAASNANSAAQTASQAAQNAQEAASHSVRYDSTQSLTEAEKTTVRANVGLTAVDDGNGNITFT